MIEFASVLLISRSRLIALDDSLGVLHGNKKHIRGTQALFRNMVNSVAGGEDLSFRENTEVEKVSRGNRKCYSNPDNIDFVALFMFLLSYLLFNCYYIFHYV